MKKYLFPLYALCFVAIIILVATSSFKRYQKKSTFKTKDGVITEYVPLQYYSKTKKSEIQFIETGIRDNQEGRSDLNNFKNFYQFIKSPSVIGFYGAKKTRMEFEITKISATAEKWNYNIEGAFFLDKQIIPVDGTIKIKKVGKEIPQYRYVKYPIEFEWNFNSMDGADNFIGNGMIALGTYLTNKLQLEKFGEDLPCKSIALAGYHLSNNVSVPQQIIMTDDLEALGEKFFANFIIYGDRDFYINPKYTKLGWSDDYVDWKSQIDSIRNSIVAKAN
jgi:hypothetical protein